MKNRVIEEKSKWRKVVGNLRALNGATTTVGLFGHGGTATDDLAARGAVHEFGNIKGTIPSRPFMRQTFDNNQAGINSFRAKQFQRIIAGQISVNAGISQLGEWYANKIKQTIRTGEFTALKEATIRRKGSSKPLIDSGEMLRAVTHKESNEKLL